MKKCEYCAKELDSYHLQYCKDSDCEERALAFYEKRRSTEKTFGVINIIAVIAIMAGLIAAIFAPAMGCGIVACALVLLGITIIIWPYAPENFYQSYRIKKTCVIVRVFGVTVLIAAVVFGVLSYCYSTGILPLK